VWSKHKSQQNKFYSFNQQIMTSTIATNFVSSKLARPRFLETNENGQPLQGQVPLTYQLYEGDGDETIVYDGSNVLAVTQTLSDGPLTIDFTHMNNYYGRTVEIIVEQEIVNVLNLDFGDGWLYVPPIGTPIHTTTLPTGFSPMAAQITFYDTDKAMLVMNPVVIPQRIAPGSDGQVLTTVSGTAQWADPAAPKSLTFRWSTNAANDLNSSTAQQVLFVDDPANNDTDLVLGAGSVGGTIDQFTVATATKYTISYDAFIVADPSVAFRGLIGVNSDIYSYAESSLGLTGQRLSGSVTLDLAVGDLVAIYIGNATGTVTPISPLDANYGNVSIIQYM